MQNEKEFTIPIPDSDLKIYAKQYGALEGTVAVFVHGLSGHMEEHLFYNGARYFYEHGIASLRFNLYDWHDDARKLIDCTLRTHADDLNTVLGYLNDQNTASVSAIGHSYGGPTILLANQEMLDTIVLWDPSHGDVFGDDENEVTFVPALNAYHVNWGTSFLIGTKMREMEKELPWNSLTEKITAPLQVISAGRGELIEQGKRYAELASGPREHITLDGASHNFDEEGVAEMLYSKSVDWILANAAQTT